jgi:hypothetical protein
MSTFYDSPNDYRNYLCHYGVKGMKWRNRRNTSLRAHRLEQARKVYPWDRVREVNDENRARHEEREAADRRSNRRSSGEEYNQYREDKLRRQEQIETERQREQERIAGMKARGQTVTSNVKKNQNLLRQVGALDDSSNNHRMVGLMNQRGRVRRRRHGH